MNIDFSKIQFGIAQLWMFIFKIFWDQNIYFMRINIREFGIVIYSRINVPMNVCQHLSTLTEEIPLNMLILQIQWSRNFFFKPTKLQLPPLHDCCDSTVYKSKILNKHFRKIHTGDIL